LGYSVRIADSAKKDLKKLSHEAAGRIMDALDDLDGTEDPRSKGKALTGPLRGFWRYRVGDYRIVCELNDNELLVLVITVGHRSTIYRNK
jgi:addiction module toxin, RelE/StbE family